MKTLALALAASLIASSYALADNALFDVNDAPLGYGANIVDTLDTEFTSSTDVNPAEYKPMDNPALFD